MTDLLPLETSTFMMIVEGLEKLAGILVFLRPIIGGYLVMTWLILIAFILIGSGSHLEVAALVGT